jgi:CBS domain-containing protein
MSTDLRTVRAAEVMTKSLVWVQARETLRAAALRMKQQRVRALLVAGDQPGDLPGIITGKDIVNLLGSEDPAILDHTTVGDVMTRPAFCVPASTNLVDCINLMRMGGVRRVPVLDGTTVVGILSASDVFDCALRD